MHQHVQNRHEPINSHLKEWKCLKEKCRHGLTKCSAMLHAVVVVSQILLASGDINIFDAHMMMTISQAFLPNMQTWHYSNNNKPSLYVTILESTKLIGLFLAATTCCCCEQSCAISDFFFKFFSSNRLLPQ